MKKLFFLTALLCASVMASALTQYCQEEMVDEKGNHYFITIKTIADNTYTVILEGSSTATITGTYNINCGMAGGIDMSNSTWVFDNAGYGSLTRTFEYNETPGVVGANSLTVLKSTATGVGDLLFAILPTDADWSATCPSAADEEKPVMTSASVDSHTYKSVVLSVSATDNVGVTKYVIKNHSDDSSVGEYTAASTITINGLSAETAYDWDVYAKDAAGNVSNSSIEVTFTTDAAPANPYTNLEVGHQNQANADTKSFILLSVGSIGNGKTVVTIRQDSEKNSAMFDYINVVGVKAFGVDVTSGGASSMGAIFNTPGADANGDISFTLQWSTVNWTGRWECSVKLPADATCATIDPFPAGPYTYCGYTDTQLKWNDVYIQLTWNTTAAGDVEISIADGDGATNTHFRSGGFEYDGGRSFSDSWHVYSGANHCTCESASTYFTEERAGNNGNTYALRKKDGVSLPNNAIIYFDGRALSWTNDQCDNNAYVMSKLFSYTYGENCASLTAPENVAISADSVITFDAVANAEKYTAYVYLNSVLKYQQEVTSGGVLHFFPYEDGTYKVNVIASAEGLANSAPSDDVDWVLTPREIVLTTIELSAASTYAKLATDEVALTVVCKDQNGNVMASDFSYEVTPAAAGSITDGVYTAATIGAATIVAKKGTVVSNSISIYGVTSNNLAQNKTVVAGYTPGNVGEAPSKVVDGNNGTEWTTWQNQPAAKEWLYIDLDGLYDIEVIEVIWGKDESTNYILQGRATAPTEEEAAADSEWTNLADAITTATASSVIYTTTNVKKIQYVRIHSLARRNADLIRLKEVRVFGQVWEDTGTAIDNTNDDVKAVKVIENGQLVIIKNGVKYNVIGKKL